MYAVVNFTCDNSVEAVPKAWLRITDEICICYWPKDEKGRALEKLLRSDKDPSAAWSVFTVIVMKNDIGKRHHS